MSRSSQSLPVSVSYTDDPPVKGKPYPLSVVGQPVPVQVEEYLTAIPGYADGTALMVMDGRLTWVAI